MHFLPSIRAATENHNLISDVAEGKYRFGRWHELQCFQLQPLLSLYVLPLVKMPPEVAITSWRSVFEKPYVKKNLILLAIDEVHCICEWLVNRIPLYVMYLEINYVFFFVGVQRLVDYKALPRLPSWPSLHLPLLDLRGKLSILWH